MKNKGISLITLVITIIIMIILAGAIILSLTNSGIFDKANEATDTYSLKQVQAIADLAWSEAYADGARDKDSLQAAVNDALRVNGLEGKYTAIADEKGVTVSKVGDQGNGGNGGGQGDSSSVPDEWQENVSAVTADNVPIPKGFVVSPYGAHDDFLAENTRDGGLVIYALTPDEIAEGETDILKIDGKNGELTLKEAHYVSMETRNQFVWVPVDKNNFKDKFKRTAFNGETLSPTLESDYWELVLDDDNMPSKDTENDNIDAYVSPATLTEATEMYESVAEYGGFYIARYEVGYAYDESGNKVTSITMGKYPYNYVAWGEEMIEDADDNGAVSQSRAFYPKNNNNYGVVSTLTYGVQWDRTLSWWKELDSNFDLENSTGYGVYGNTKITLEEYNSGAKYIQFDAVEYYFVDSWAARKAKNDGDWYLITTGGYKKANVYNIYDMAGNLLEWTMEGINTDSRVFRGGDFISDGGCNPVVHRNFCLPVGDADYYGFRPSLYIK